MPIYEYRCAECGHELDVLQKISDSPLRKCPECGKSKLKRLVSAPAFRLKGSGWYETDFKKDGDRKRNLSEKGGEAKSEAKSDAKSDAKPAATSSDAAPAAKSEAKPARTEAPAAAKPAAGTP